MERRSPFIWNKCWDCAIGADIGLGKKSVRYWLAKGERRSEKGRTHTKTRNLQQCNIKLNWIKVNEWQIAQHWLHAAAARSNEERIGNDNRWNWRERIKKRIQIEFQTNENSGANVTFSNADFSLALSHTMFVLCSVSISSWLQTVASFQPIYYLWQTVNLVLLTLNAHGWWSARSSPCTLSESMRHTEDITQSIQQASTQCHSQCQKIYVQTKYF